MFDAYQHYDAEKIFWMLPFKPRSMSSQTNTREKDHQVVGERNQGENNQCGDHQSESIKTTCDLLRRTCETTLMPQSMLAAYNLLSIPQDQPGTVQNHVDDP